MVKSTSSAKANVTPPKHSSPQQTKFKMSVFPRTDNDGVNAKKIHQICTMSKADGTPYSWAFLGFFGVKEWIKSMCNHDGMNTVLGNQEFKPFTNLTIRWILHSR